MYYWKLRVKVKHQKVLGRDNDASTILRTFCLRGPLQDLRLYPELALQVLYTGEDLNKILKRMHHMALTQIFEETWLIHFYYLSFVKLCHFIMLLCHNNSMTTSASLSDLSKKNIFLLSKTSLFLIQLHWNYLVFCLSTLFLTKHPSKSPLQIPNWLRF